MTSATPPSALPAAVLGALADAPRRALTMTELSARLGRLCPDRSALDQAVALLAADRQVLVLVRALHDVHYPDPEVRVVSAIEEGGRDAVQRATAAAEAHWQEFLREFLSAHRCQ